MRCLAGRLTGSYGPTKQRLEAEILGPYTKIRLIVEREMTNTLTPIPDPKMLSAGFPTNRGQLSCYEAERHLAQLQGGGAV